ncbi:GlxA family transcriptional regulator [Vibrio nigripulchritudo]|uniref:GlxA family transcriptional regulator n=1 Tax=Vibrio nigripulchritudo TaxID=28173 RepID=UPI0005FA08EC|nr:GlxA family transcriptional regulator [Vibrio nigripulchritudo]KJY78342.1 transcriptional regulator [Vibrio nigripulchritudo]
MKPNDDGSITLSFLLIPEFAMIALVAAIEPLRIANRIVGREIFKWELLSESTEPVAASNLLTINQSSQISTDNLPKNVFVCSSFHPQNYHTQKITRWLKLAFRSGATLGAIDTGCYFLAEAGVLRDRKVTLHWEAIPAFSEDYPSAKISYELFEIDGNLMTCAGGTSSIDMMLFIIQQQLGRDVALQVCEQFIQSKIRPKSQSQRIDLVSRLNIHHPRLLNVISIMETNIDDPLTAEELAAKTHISVRQLQRLFRANFNKTISRYYLELRLERARHLLRETRLSISDVGAACGFNSAPHFATSYKNFFEVSPSEDRDQ